MNSDIIRSEMKGHLLSSDISSDQQVFNLEGKVIPGKYTLVSKTEQTSGDAVFYRASDSSHKYFTVRFLIGRSSVSPESLAGLRRLKSPYVAEILDYGLYEDYPFIVLPYFRNGSLAGKLLTSDAMRHIVVPDVSAGLKYLHRNNIFHNNIRPSSLMISDDGKHVQIVDYNIGSFRDPDASDPVTGTSEQILSEKQTQTKTKTVFRPESSSSEISPSKGAEEYDYCCFGFTLFELFCGYQPFNTFGTKDSLTVVSPCQRLYFTDGFPADLKILITGLTCGDRISSRDGNCSYHRWADAEIEKWQNESTANVSAEFMSDPVTGSQSDTETDCVEDTHLKFTKPYDFKNPENRAVYLYSLPEFIEAFSANWNEGRKHVDRSFVSDFFIAQEMRCAAIAALECEDALVTDLAYSKMLTEISVVIGNPFFYWKSVKINEMKKLSDYLKDALDHRGDEIEDEIELFTDAVLFWYEKNGMFSELNELSNLRRKIDDGNYDIRTRVVVLCSFFDPDMSLCVGKVIYENIRELEAEISRMFHSQLIQWILDNRGDIELYSKCFAPAIKDTFCSLVKTLKRNPILNSCNDINEDLIQRIIKNDLDSLTLNYAFTKGLCEIRRERAKDRDYDDSLSRLDEEERTLQQHNLFTNPFFCANKVQSLKRIEFEVRLTSKVTSLSRAFFNMEELEYVNLKDTSGVNNMSEMFHGAKKFNQPIGGWDTSRVTDMSCMFEEAKSFNQPIGEWDTSSVTDMSCMFDEAESFNQQIGNWDVSHVTCMNCMFNGAVSFNQPLDRWDTAAVESMRGMFFGAECFNQSLNDWKFSAHVDMHSMFYNAKSFNQPLDRWDTSRITDMSCMFAYAESFNQPIGNWDTSKVTDMTRMFMGALSFNQPIGDWNTSKVTQMVQMFRKAKSFNQPIDKWDISKVTKMKFMFSNAVSFNQPLGKWDTSKVTDMCCMFAGAESFNQPINKWDTSKVTDMRGMFENAVSFNQPINKWDTSKVTDMTGMFMGAISFNQPISKWDTSKVTDMRGMFENAVSFNQPIGNWNISKVTNMERMFRNARSFNQPIGDWNTFSVTDMKQMFEGAVNFNQPINNWKTYQVTDMERMFCEAVSFNQPIGDWDMSKVTNMKCMFMHAYFFNQPVGNWDTSNVTDMENIFLGALNFNQPLKDLDVSKITNMNYMFAGARKFDQSLKEWDVSRVTNMDGMFAGAVSFNQSLNEWDVSYVTTMKSMFSGAVSFNQSLNEWDVSRVTNMDGMFAGAASFNQPVDKWDTSGVNDMKGMFSGAVSFNQSLNDWDVSCVANMESMFAGAVSFNQPVDNWDTSGVMDMKHMFEGASSFNQPVDSWNVSNVTGIDSMFKDAKSFEQSVDNWNTEKVTDKDLMFG